MKKELSLLSFLLLSSSAVYAEKTTDFRQIVEMPPPMKELFLTNMRGHMESLDLVIKALAEKDLNLSATLAESTLGLGQSEARQCDDSDSHQQHKQQSEHKHKAMAFGQFMPASMKAMGMQLHIAADNFADVARQGDMGEAYKALSQISSTCVACHQAFKVK
jgi:hypothetical protein